MESPHNAFIEHGDIASNFQCISSLPVFGLWLDLWSVVSELLPEYSRTTYVLHFVFTDKIIWGGGRVQFGIFYALPVPYTYTIYLIMYFRSIVRYPSCIS